MDEAVNSNSENKSKKTQNKIITFIKEWVIPICAALGIAFLINKFVFFNVKVPTGSMIPTININDKLVATKVYNTDKIQRGDIIVFYSDELGELLIKRTIGLPGDHIDIKSGTVYVNGEKIDESYVKNNDNYTGSFDVPEGKFFFLGDNRAVSYDARKWINPYIDSSEIKGKAQFRFYPFSEFGSLDKAE